MPWVLLETTNLAHVALKPEKGWFLQSLRTGAILGIVTLADPRWTIPCGMLALSYSLYVILQSSHPRNSWSRRDLLFRLFLIVMLVSITCAVIAACLLIPLFEFAQQSTRMGMSITERSALSMPVVGLLGVLIPQVNQLEWLAYFGIVTFCLGLSSVVARIQEARFWLAVILLAWVLALGENTPIYPLFSSVIPGAGLLRIPPRMLFIVSIASAVLAGRGVDGFLSKSDPGFVGKGIPLAAFATTTLVILFTFGMWLLTGLVPHLGVIVCVFVILTTIWIFATRNLHLPKWLIVSGWVILVVADLGWINSTILESRPKDEVLAERKILVTDLAKEPDIGRVFSTSYSLPYQTLAQGQLEAADGINPLQLSVYRDYMSQATGFPNAAYSVTLPPFPTGDPSEPWPMKFDAEMLAKLNVTHVLSVYPVQQEDLSFSGVIEGTYLYRLSLTRPRAWLETTDTGQTAWETVESVEWTPNRISVKVTGPGRLVLSELTYPGWQASLNNVAVDVHMVDGIFRGVDVPAGNFTVTFRFLPMTVLVGIGITLLSVAALIVIKAKQ
jgi:hypothetical protein